MNQRLFHITSLTALRTRRIMRDFEGHLLYIYEKEAWEQILSCINMKEFSSVSNWGQLIGRLIRPSRPDHPDSEDFPINLTGLTSGVRCAIFSTLASLPLCSGDFCASYLIKELSNHQIHRGPEQTERSRTRIIQRIIRNSSALADTQIWIVSNDMPKTDLLRSHLEGDISFTSF